MSVLSELKVGELNLTEAVKESGNAPSTVNSQTKIIKDLLIEFLDNATFLKN